MPDSGWLSVIQWSSKWSSSSHYHRSTTSTLIWMASSTNVCEYNPYNSGRFHHLQITAYAKRIRVNLDWNIQLYQSIGWFTQTYQNGYLGTWWSCSKMQNEQPAFKTFQKRTRLQRVYKPTLWLYRFSWQSIEF